tara:strand:+ start:530 stop:685 length:156 start_codon:yes stop_codon:yes gene_type:complete
MSQLEYCIEIVRGLKYFNFLVSCIIRYLMELTIEQALQQVVAAHKEGKDKI